ncbi:MAG: hypothetical protein II650_08620, partial [Clostridia bacterium]|nr:hypothetical protein [Clostridia bacterium]
MKSQRFFSLLLVLTLTPTLFTGCAKTEPETPAEPPKLEEGVAAQSAEDFALIDGELWVIEEGEAHKAGETPENETDAATESVDAAPDPSAEPAPDSPSDAGSEKNDPGFDAAFIASGGGA